MKAIYLRMLWVFALKYAAFFTLLAFLHHRFYDLVVKGTETWHDILANLLQYVMSVVFSMVIFFLPLFPFLWAAIIQIRNRILFVLMACVGLAAEWVYYTAAASTSDYSNGVYNILFTVLFLVIFFRREMPFLADTDGKEFPTV